MPLPKKFWLMKSEPEVYSIDDLMIDGTTAWEGVRNYQARNLMRDDVRAGDLVLFYHSSANPPGVAGLAKVARAAYPDPTQFDPESDHFDKAAKRESPPWVCVDVAFVERFADVVPLEVLRAQKALVGMPLLARGQRLSVQPVSPEQFRCVLRLAKAKTKV